MSAWLSCENPPGFPAPGPGADRRWARVERCNRPPKPGPTPCDRLPLTSKVQDDNSPRRSHCWSFRTSSPRSNGVSAKQRRITRPKNRDARRVLPSWNSVWTYLTISSCNTWAAQPWPAPLPSASKLPPNRRMEPRRFSAESAAVERLLDAGRATKLSPPPALLAHAQSAESASRSATTAMCQFYLGRA